MTKAYYNEVDAHAASWLRNLVAAGLVPPGDVDQRSIRDVQPGDLAGYAQCHFFAGIGGWAYACRLAGWPDERPIWTGSCPCQPFSVAGRRGGTGDARHLWPDFLRLIRAARPPVVMGEQVAGAAGYGWLDGVLADLAGEDYAGRGVDIPACAVDAPHIRSRLYWCAVANASFQSDEGRGRSGNRHRQSVHGAVNDSNLADANGCERDGRAVQQVGQPKGRTVDGRPDAGCGLGHAAGIGQRAGPRDDSGDPGCEQLGGLEAGEPRGDAFNRDDSLCGLGDAVRQGWQGHGAASLGGTAQQPAARLANAGRNGTHWSGADWLACHDGKARRAQSGAPLLVDGLPGRVALWRGFGNAIVPQVAAEVIAAFMDCEPAPAAGGGLAG